MPSSTQTAKRQTVRTTDTVQPRWFLQRDDVGIVPYNFDCTIILAACARLYKLICNVTLQISPI